MSEYENMEEPKNTERKTNRKTGAKKGKGKKVALTLLVIGGLTAGAIFGTKAYYSCKENSRVNTIIEEYTVENYVALPNEIATNRAYDITYAKGKTLTKNLTNKGINCININGILYTPNGENVKIITYNVTYTQIINPIEIKADGQMIYTAPTGFTLNGTKAERSFVETRTVIVDETIDPSQVKFENATSIEMVGEPKVVSTLPYSVIEDSTLICDVPDNATLDENSLCTGSLELAPKKH